MKFFLLSGSHRSNSQSLKVTQHLAQTLEKLGHSTHTYSLERNPLPLWDEGVWSNQSPWIEKWTPVASELALCDGLVIVSPEWGGMASPGVKNFLLLLSSSDVKHKPATLVSVSGSRNGAYPIAELKMTASKNNYLCFTPEHLIVRDVEQVLNGEEANSEDDQYIRTRSVYAMKVLVEYAKALASVRQSGVIDSKNFPFGM